MGLVTGFYPGTARMMVSFSGVASEAEVTVVEAAEQVIRRVEVTPSSASLDGIGETIQLAAAAFDADDEPVADAEFTWSSSHPAVTTVDGGGR